MANRPIKDKSYTHVVALFDSNGDPITGADETDVDVYFKKPGEQNVNQKSLSSGDFTEIDSTNMTGLYGITFTATDMDTAGELVGSVNPSSGTSLDIQQYNFRFTIEAVTHRDLESAINAIELSGNGGSGDFPNSPTVQVENFPEHYVAEVKRDTQYSWEFKIVDPDGVPIEGITSTDVDITVLSGGGPNTPAGSPQVLSSTIDSTWTEVDPTGAPGWYSLTLEPSDTSNLGDLDIDISLDGVSIDQEGAEVQDTPTNYENVPSVFMRDLNEGYFVTNRGEPDPGGQLLQTTNGGNDWAVQLKVANVSGVDYSLAGFYDIDGLEGSPGEFAGLFSNQLKASQGSRRIALAYEYGGNRAVETLVNDDNPDFISLSSPAENERILKPNALSETDNRSWYAYETIDENNLVHGRVGYWNRFTSEKVVDLREEELIDYEDIYALTEDENSAQKQILESSQTVNQECAIYWNTIDDFVRIVFEDDTTGELVYIDNEGGSFGPRSVIDGTDNPGSPTILAWDENTSTPKLVVVYARNGSGDIRIASYDFAGGTSVTGSSWTVNDLDVGGFFRPDATLDQNTNIHICYVDSTRDNIYHQTQRTGQYVKSTVWSSGGAAKATYPAITDNQKVVGDGFVTIGATIATDGANTDEVRRFKEPDPATNNWPDTLVDSESSVSEDEFSRGLGVDFDSTKDVDELLLAYVKKNQNSADPPTLFSLDAGGGLIEPATLSSFTGVVNVAPREGDPGENYFYVEDNGEPTLIHPTFGGTGWVKRTVDGDVDVNLPIGTSQLFDSSGAVKDFKEDVGIVKLIGVDQTSNDLVFYDFDTESSDTIVVGGFDESSGTPKLHIEKTTDGGKNWTESTVPDVAGQITRIDFVDQTEGYAVSTGGYVLQTTDGGDTWTQVNQINNTDLYGVWSPASGEVSVVGRDNNEEGPIHYESKDGGSTFSEFGATSEVSSSALFTSIDGSGEECWITGDDGEVVHCFKTVTFSGGRTFRFQVVEYYEADTYNLVNQVKGTVDDTNTKATEIQNNVDTVETKVDNLDSDVQTVDNTVDDTNTKVSEIQNNVDTVETKVDDLDSDVQNVDSTVDDTNTKVSEIQNNVDTVENKIDNLDTDTTEILNGLERVLGLQGENYRSKNYQFDTETGKLTSVDWVLYDNASDAQNDVNPIAEYSIDITLDAEGEPSEYVATRVS